MKKDASQGTLLLIATPIVVGCVIVAAAWMIARSYSAGAFVEWQLLGVLPAEAGRFEAAEFDQKGVGVVFITASDGNIYRGSSSLCAADRGCWQVVETFPAPNLEGNFSVSIRCENSRYARMAPPPGDNLSCAHYSDISTGSQLTRDVFFVLLADGTVWGWQFVPGMGALGILLMGVVVAIVGIVLTLPFMVYYRRRRFSEARP